MAADPTTETWKLDIGQAREIVLERSSVGYRATYDGFRGSGSTKEIALDDLLACMRSYCEAAADLERSLAPGGRLHDKLRQLSEAVDQVVAQEQQR